MRRIDKSTEINALMTYEKNNPTCDWDSFRQYNEGKDYTLIKDKIFSEQSDICAYCEINLKDTLSHNKRVEHFISKSDTSSGKNLHLDWFNIIGVCLGGSDFESRQHYNLPENLSCDSHKAYIEDTENVIDKNWNGRVLSPLSIPKDHNLFIFNKVNGHLLPNESTCSNLNIVGNKHESTLLLVNETIRVFNLNCDRLSSARLVLFRQLQHQLKSANKNNDMGIIERFVSSWRREFPLFFQTTRDIILSENKITAKYL